MGVARRDVPEVSQPLFDGYRRRQEDAEQDREAAEYRRELLDRRRAQVAAARGMIENSVGVLRTILELHAPVERDHALACEGCDQDCWCGVAEWPCSTWHCVLGITGSDDSL